MAISRLAFKKWVVGMLLFLAMLPPIPAGADQPPAAPANFSVASRSGRYSAFLDATARQVTVFEHHNGTKSQLWAIQNWSLVAAVSDVGPTLAIGNPGNNLLSPNASEDTVIVSLYQHGSLVRQVKLGEILPTSRLRRTISHVEWGTHIGFNAKGQYVVEAEDKRVLAFGLEGKPEIVGR